MLTDNQLVAKTLADGGHHYSELIKRYQNYVYSICVRIVAGDHHLAEDISQTTFIKSYKYLDKYENSKPFKAWIGKIAVNCALDTLNAESKHKTNIATENLYTTDGNDIEFFDLIKVLSPEKRSIFILRYIYGYTTAEIAPIVNIKQSTIKSQLYRALEQLRLQLRATTATEKN